MWSSILLGRPLRCDRNLAAKSDAHVSTALAIVQSLLATSAVKHSDTGHCVGDGYMKLCKVLQRLLNPSSTAGPNFKAANRLELKKEWGKHKQKN